MAAKKRGLGRGLDALFDSVPVEEETGVAEEGVTYVDINEIKPNENQPRKVFDEEKLDELAASIKEHGIIQPIVLRKEGDGYEIVAGERRYRAARKAGLKKVPCVIRELTEDQNLLIAIIENMQREDLNPIEEAEGLSRMIDVYGLTQDAVSKSVGKSRPYITNSLRLLKLPDEVQKLTETGAITAGHARAIAGIEDEERQIAVARKVAQDGLSVREVERLATGTNTKVKRKPVEKSPDQLRVEAELKEKLGTKVNISRSQKRGKIEIEYYSREELERLIETLKSI